MTAQPPHFITSPTMPNSRLVSRFEPEDDGGNDDHRPVVDRTLLVAGGQSTPLFEPVDTALDYIATGVDRPIENQWTTSPRRTARLLITSFRNRVRDLPLAQQATTARIAVPFVSDEPVRTSPRTPPPTRSWNANASQHWPQLGAVMPLPRRNDNRERPPFPVAGQVEFGRQSAATTSEPFIARMLNPLLISAWLGRRRAPLACW